MTIVDFLSRLWADIVEAGPQVVAALLILAAAWLVGTVLRRLAGLLFRRARLTTTHTQFFRSLVFWVVLILGISLALNVLGVGFALSGFLAGGGVAAIVIGFAFKEIGENLLAGLFLAFSRPFEVNDFVHSEGLEGEVQAITLRYTHIRTADGRDIFIPNAQIFNKPLVNFTRDGLRRPTFRIGIDYRDNAGAACRLLAEAAGAIENVLADPAPRATIAAFREGYVEIEMTFWMNSFGTARSAAKQRIAQERDLLLIKSDVMEACRRTLADNGFTFSSEVSTAMTVARDPSVQAFPAGG